MLPSRALEVDTSAAGSTPLQILGVVENYLQSEGFSASLPDGRDRITGQDRTRYFERQDLDVVVGIDNPQVVFIRVNARNDFDSQATEIFEGIRSTLAGTWPTAVTEVP
jgi:hypothetical protein